MQTMIRLENAHDDIDREIGPFDFVQITYDALRVAPHGEEIGFRDTTGMWTLNDGSTWSDVIMYAAASDGPRDESARGE